MKSFLKYVQFREADEQVPVPPGVDPEMWNNPSYRKFWLYQNPDYLKSVQTPQQMQPQAPRQSPYQVQRGGASQKSASSMSRTEIDNAIRAYLGNNESGSVINLDKRTQDEISSLVRSGNLEINADKGKAIQKGNGIHFFRGQSGLEFIRNAAGSRPFNKPFGRNY